MNKKKLYKALPLVAILSVVLVSAAVLVYYGQIKQNVDVKQAVELICPNNDCTEELGNMFSGDTLISSVYTLNNIAYTSRDVELVTSSNPWTAPGEIVTSYSEVKELQLSKKIVVFGSANWVLEGNLITVKYTSNGNEFLAEVVEEISGYVLIYYADNVDRFNNVAKAINVEYVDASLPYVGDQNAVGGEYNMCDIEGYETCHGAKIWYVPSNAIDENNNIDWSQADDFYFETDLIEYNNQETLDNPITIQADGELSFVVVNEFDTTGFDGTITTQVLPA